MNEFCFPCLSFVGNQTPTNLSPPPSRSDSAESGWALQKLAA